MVVGKKLDDVFMVMEFLEHDLKGLMEERDSSNPLFAMSEVCPVCDCVCLSVRAAGTQTSVTCSSPQWRPTCVCVCVCVCVCLSPQWISTVCLIS